MGSLVQHTPRLEAVSLAGCNITGEGAEPLVVVLTECVTQTTLPCTLPSALPVLADEGAEP
ncbi:hypothetical protein DUNSADRAFT_13076 [Dunaliella salina]|uniref:Encoded protein n=1 Tax=Dunaliella salina TaxID=3046 RepID=A0ABQ7H3H3_DUNSA|nr:hypothetical protein DUNSADRAFT_13076 [Dunaliella salina]|eukprot:KAF5841413.1 hypothetical protein DUNSADRAFT_13076 [Dunaliella salina]